MKTLVIAEVAGCHDGDLTKALRLIDLARESGADMVKFQWLSSPERLIVRRHAPEYLDAYRTLAFSREWFPTLVARCSEPRDDSPWSTDPPGRIRAIAPVEFMCSVFLPEDIAVVAPYVSRFKVSSFEAEDAHFVALHGAWPEKQLIISAGMNADVRESLRRYAAVAGVPSGDEKRAGPAVLHCVSAYPCPNDQIGLMALRPTWFAPSPQPMFTGLSDHTRHPWTGAFAIAAGATIVEFHVRLDDTTPTNADYAVARTPEEARAYVENIRTAEAMLGSGEPGPQECEKDMMRFRVGATP